MSLTYYGAIIPNKSKKKLTEIHPPSETNGMK